MEVSIVSFKQLDHIKNRLDAEYYQNKFLTLDTRITELGETSLSQINAKLDCSAFYPSITDDYNFDSVGVPFLRVNEIKGGMVSITESTAFLPQTILDSNPSTIAIGYPNDLIIAKGGNTLAKVGLLTDQYPYYALSRDLILLRTNEISTYNKYCLWVFLHSKYGQDLLWRTASQTGQPHLTLPSIYEIKLPNFSSDFQNIFEDFYAKSVELKNKSKKLYAEAEALLLSELGLKDFIPSDEPIAIKSFCESFGVSGRLDSEYYQAKYDDIISKIKSYKGGYKTLGAITRLKKSIEPGSDAYGNEGVGFLRVADLFKFELREPEIKLSESLFDPQTLDDLKPKKGEVLLSKDGSVGIAYTVREDANFIPSGAIVRLQQISDILPDVLALMLNSQIVQLQAERDAGGSIIQHWKPSEINEVLLPLIDENVQKIIAEKISESFALKIESKHLLDIAKQAVEIAIEKNENAAIHVIMEDN